MPLIIRLGTRADGGPSPFADSYLMEFDPTRILVHPDGTEEYIIAVTDDKTEALQFADVSQAMDYYMQSVGTRRDGEPDRPLMEFNFSIHEAQK
jgi:hypothetical protein